MTSQFSQKVSQILAFSREEAIRLSSKNVSPEHLLLGLLRDKTGPVHELFILLDINCQTVKAELEKKVRCDDITIPFNLHNLTLDESASNILKLAVWARNENTGAEVLWIGCPNMDNEQLYQSMPGNLTFLQGCAASLVGQDVLVDTKTLEAEPITVAGSAAAALGLTFVFVLPAAVLIAGAVVVLLRRRR